MRLLVVDGETPSGTFSPLLLELDDDAGRVARRHQRNDRTQDDARIVRPEEIIGRNARFESFDDGGQLIASHRGNDQLVGRDDDEVIARGRGPHP